MPDTPLPLEPHPRWLTLDDRSIGVHFGAWFLIFVFNKWGIDLAEEFSRKSCEKVLAEHDALFRDLPSAAFDLDQHDVEGVILQTAAQLYARCELERAGALVRDFIEKREDLSKAKSEVEAGKARQRAKAEKPRPTPLSELIDEIVSRSPNISESDLIGRLMSDVGNGLIEDITNDEIVWSDDEGNEKKSKLTGLKDMLYRAKKKLRKGQ